VSSQKGSVRPADGGRVDRSVAPVPIQIPGYRPPHSGSVGEGPASASDAPVGRPGPAVAGHPLVEAPGAGGPQLDQLALQPLAGADELGAGSVALGGDPKLQVLDAAELPAPERGDITGGAQPYYVGPYDKLIVDVFAIEELAAREIQVDASGRMSFPLAGVLDVSGKTPAEIEQELAARLRQAYVRDPQVTVNLKEAISQVVTIAGQVKKPGLYPVMGRMTLLRAIARAEGTDEYSDLEDVVVFRTVQGRRLAALYDVERIRRGAYADPEIYPNDVVMVADNSSRRLFKDLLTTFSLVSGPLVIAIDRLAN